MNTKIVLVDEPGYEGETHRLLHMALPMGAKIVRIECGDGEVISVDDDDFVVYEVITGANDYGYTAHLVRGGRSAVRGGAPVALNKDGKVYTFGAQEFSSATLFRVASQSAIYSMLTVEDAAVVAQTSEHAVYAVLQDDERRAAIFPGAYHTNPDNPRRGEWRIPRSEVEAWKPRRTPPQK